MGKRNIQGGKKTKAMARYDSVDNSHFIHPNPPEQQIAIVTQVLGNSQFLATFHNMQTTIAVLPGKMKGKNKRNFLVQKFSFILIQLRTDMSLPYKITDILHIYPNHHLPRIFNDFPAFISILNSDTHNDLIFDNNDHDIITLTDHEFDFDF
jgi:hypothetical protein